MLEKKDKEGNDEMMIFDSHAHYDDEAFDEDREDLLGALKESGIGKVVNVGASMNTSRTSIELAKKYDYIYASIGVHPSETEELTEEKSDELKGYSKLDKVVAIGEIGLDYYYPTPDRDLQKKWFYKQLDLAVETKLPVIIHSREAAKETMDILKEYQGRITKGVIHCYSYGVEMAKEFVNMGYYIGIGGVLTFNNAKKLKEVAKEIPIDKIVLETDCPYLSPVPNRGKRNSSINLEYVVKELAVIKGISEDEVKEITYNNAMKLYGLE